MLCSKEFILKFRLITGGQWSV